MHCLAGEVSLEQLRKLLRRLLGHSEVLKEDIAHFDREEDKPEPNDHNYLYLLNSLDRYLRRAGRVKNNVDFEGVFEQNMRNMKAGKQLTAAQMMQALAATSTKDPKRKGKDRNKGRQR